MNSDSNSNTNSPFRYNGAFTGAIGSFDDSPDIRYGMEDDDHDGPLIGPDGRLTDLAKSRLNFSSTKDTGVIPKKRSAPAPSASDHEEEDSSSSGSSTEDCTARNAFAEHQAAMKKKQEEEDESDDSSDTTLEDSKPVASTSCKNAPSRRFAKFDPNTNRLPTAGGIKTKSAKSGGVVALETSSSSEEEDGMGSYELLHLKKGNCKKTLLAMSYAVSTVEEENHEDIRNLADLEEEPWKTGVTLGKSASDWKPIQKDYKDEVIRRALFIKARNDEELKTNPKAKKYRVPKPSSWKSEQVFNFLRINNWAIAPENLKFVRTFEPKFRQEVADAVEEKKRLVQESARAAAWTTDEPWCRSYHSAADENAKEAFLRKDDCMDHEELDARNSEDRPPGYYQIAADNYNDRNKIHVTDALPELHHRFRKQMTLRREDMPGPDVTADDMKERLGSSKAQLVQVSARCSGSGRGDGQLAEGPAFANMGEDQKYQEGSRRRQALEGASPHVLYMWHLFEKGEMLHGTMGVLGPSCKITSDDIPPPTTGTGNASKKDEAAKAAAFREKLGGAMGSLAFDSAVKSLREEEANRRVLKREQRAINKSTHPEDWKEYQEDISNSNARIKVLEERVKSMQEGSDEA